MVSPFMTLIWILTWLPLVLPAVTHLPKPINIRPTLTYSDFILRWDPGAATPTGTSYSVNVKPERGVSETPVTNCQHVHHTLSCNLTELLTDLSALYTVQVTAQLEGQSSEPAEAEFKPIALLDLPLLMVQPCSSDLCVDLQPPNEHPREIYNNINYQLQISSKAGGAAQSVKDFRSLERQNLTGLAPGREYCVSVRFSDTVVDKHSNFSRPVCASTPAVFSTDPLIVASLCLLGLLGVVILVLLFQSGFICLKQSPMPSVLMSIQHWEEVLAVSSIVNVSLIAPPAGEKNRRLSSSSEDSDEECGTEASCRGSSGGAYSHRFGTTLLSSSSSSSSLSSKQKLPPTFCSKTSGGFNLQPKDTQSRTELSSGSCGGVVTGRTEEQQEGVGEVNFLTLTFGRQEEEEEDGEHGEDEDQEEEEEPGREDEDQEEEQDSPDASEESISPPVPPVLPVLPSPSATGASSWTVEDEEEVDEDCGYMGRPPADDLQTFLSKT